MKHQDLPPIESWAMYGVMFSRFSFRSSAAMTVKLDDGIPGRLRALWSDRSGRLRSKGLKLINSRIESMLLGVGDPVIEFYSNAVLMVVELLKSGRVAEVQRMQRAVQQYSRKGKMAKEVEAFFRETWELKTTPSAHLKAFSSVWNKYRDRNFEIDELAVRIVEATALGKAMEEELRQVLHLDSRFGIQLTKLQNARRLSGALLESAKVPVKRSSSVDLSDQGMTPSDWSGDDVDSGDSGD